MCDPAVFLETAGLFALPTPMGLFCPLNNPCVKAPNCSHCGQMCLPRGAHDTLAFSCFLAAASKIPRFCPFRRFQRLPHFLFRPNPLRWASVEFSVLPHVGATSGFWVSGGYAPGCARKIGHSRDTRLTRADSWLLAVPVETLPTAFGCVPAHTLRPALQAFARKTAGWRAEWAGACTEDSRFVFDHPA